MGPDLNSDHNIAWIINEIPTCCRAYNNAFVVVVAAAAELLAVPQEPCIVERAIHCARDQLYCRQNFAVVVESEKHL